MIQNLTNKEALLDALFVLYDTSKNDQTESVQRFIELYESVYREELDKKLSIQDFEVIHKDAFARGAFGKVTLVKRKDQIYAMKILSKSYLVSQIDRSSPVEEKLVLSGSHEWLPKLYCSFQDQKNLYLVMEYAPGGDLQGLMERKQYKFTEQEAQFYIAELVLAVESIHQLGYMHRDIKPGNILIGLDGHIKLGDLGSCIAIHTKNPLFMVGTMSYVSPEMCNSEGSDPSMGPAYGPESDWWSVGIMLYELLYGEPPFTGKDIQIQMKLLDPTFNIQLNDSISNEANDLISKLLHKSSKHRLDISGIKTHAFFKDIQWDTLHSSVQPPFIPVISSMDDLTFFSVTPKDEDDDDDDYEEDKEPHMDFPFIGYTFTKNLIENDSILPQCSTQQGDGKEEIPHVLEDMLSDQRLKENRIEKLEKENKQYKKVLEDKTESEKLARSCLNVLKEENEHYKKELEANKSLLTRLDALEAENKQYKEELETERSALIQLNALENENKIHEELAKKEIQTQLEEFKAEKQSILNDMCELKEENKLLTSYRRELQDRVIHLEKQIQLMKSIQSTSSDYKDCLKELTEENNKLRTTNNSLEEKHAQQLKLQEKCFQTRLEQSKKTESGTTGKSNIISSMWQKDRENLHHVQRSLEDSENQLAWTKREVIRLKKEIKCYQTQSFEQQKIEMTEKKGLIKMAQNMIDDSKFRRRRRVGLSSSVSSFSSYPTKDLSLKASVNDTQKQIDIEKEFIASTQRTLAARSKLSRTKTEFDQELQSSIDRSNSKVLLLQYKLQQVK